MNRALCSILPRLACNLRHLEPTRPGHADHPELPSPRPWHDRIVDAVSPGAASEVLEELREALGLRDLEGIDRARPWQIALWADDFTAPPCLSVRIPVTDFATFQNGLEPGFLKGDAGAERPIEQVGDYAKIWLPFGSPSETTRAAEKAWQPDTLTDRTGVLRLVIHPNPSIRAELLNGLAMGRMTVGMAMAGQEDQALEGIDMKAMGQLLGVYFDVMETGLKGFESFLMELDLEADSLNLREIITPLAGSESGRLVPIQSRELSMVSARYLDRMRTDGLGDAVRRQPGAPAHA
jgi:hypothetical protein